LEADAGVNAGDFERFMLDVVALANELLVAWPSDEAVAPAPVP